MNRKYRANEINGDEDGVVLRGLLVTGQGFVAGTGAGQSTAVLYRVRAAVQYQ